MSFHINERQRRLRKVISARVISHDTNKEFEEQLTLGQHMADRIASFGGSWTFVTGFLTFLTIWIIINGFVLVQKGIDPFDPFPFILLNLALSMIAAIQAPLILMSQNRQASKDRLDAEHNYEVNLKAELEIMELHRKIDVLLRQVNALQKEREHEKQKSSESSQAGAKNA